MIWKVAENLKFFLDKCKKDNINAFAAQSAFFIILSAIPFLMVFSSLLQYTPVTEQIVVSIVNQTMPEYIAPFCISVIGEVYNKSVGIVSMAAVIAIWSAAKGVQYLASGLNVINNIQETRNWFVLRFWAVVYTVVFVVAVAGCLVLLVFGNSLKKMLIEYLPFSFPGIGLTANIRSLYVLGILILFFVILYKTLPNRKVTLRSQIPGALLCGLAWYGVSFGLSIYVQYFNGFSMYGSLTTIALIMLWMYFCMYIMMACAEINVIFEDAFRKWLQKYRNRKEKG